MNVTTWVEQAKAIIDAICRDRQLTPTAKLDAMDEIERHADKSESKVRAVVRKAHRAAGKPLP